MSSPKQSKTLPKEVYDVTGFKKLYPNALDYRAKPVLVYRSVTAVPETDLFNKEKTIGTDLIARDAIPVVYDKSNMTLENMTLKDQSRLLKKIFEEKDYDNTNYLNIISSHGTGISAGSLYTQYKMQGGQKIGYLLDTLLETLASQPNRAMDLTKLLSFNSVKDLLKERFFLMDLTSENLNNLLKDHPNIFSVTLKDGKDQPDGSLKNNVAEMYVKKLQDLVKYPFMTDLTPEAIQVRQALFRLTPSKVNNPMIGKLMKHVKREFHINSRIELLLQAKEIDNLCNNKTGDKISRFRARKYIMETLFVKSGTGKFWEDIKPKLREAKLSLALEKLLNANVDNKDLMNKAHDEIFYPKSPPEEESKYDGKVTVNWRKDKELLYCIFGKKNVEVDNLTQFKSRMDVAWADVNNIVLVDSDHTADGLETFGRLLRPNKIASGQQFHIFDPILSVDGVPKTVNLKDMFKYTPFAKCLHTNGFFRDGDDLVAYFDQNELTNNEKEWNKTVYLIEGGSDVQQDARTVLHAKRAFEITSTDTHEINFEDNPTKETAALLKCLEDHRDKKVDDVDENIVIRLIDPAKTGWVITDSNSFSLPDPVLSEIEVTPDPPRSKEEHQMQPLEKFVVVKQYPQLQTYQDDDTADPPDSEEQLQKQPQMELQKQVVVVKQSPQRQTYQDDSESEVKVDTDSEPEVRKPE
eukprot:883200_1